MGRKKEKSRKIVLDWKNSSLRVLEDGKTRGVEEEAFRIR